MRTTAPRFHVIPLLALGGAVLWGAIECVALFWSRLGGRGRFQGKSHAH